MKIISTNLGKATTITWNNKEEKTGIFKYPTNTSLTLETNDVADDTVIDRVHHGGINKACYLFSADYYSYWKKLYPNLDWDWGMFGENLTIEGFNEAHIRVGDIYKIGTALVQVTEPREPCYKLGIRFENQSVLKKFIEHGHPGTYIKILEEGEVKKGDTLVLVEQSKNELTVQHFFELLYAKKKSKEVLQLFMNNPLVPQNKKERFKKFL